MRTQTRKQCVRKAELTPINAEDIMFIDMRCYLSTVALVSLQNTALTYQAGRFIYVWFLCIAL